MKTKQLLFGLATALIGFNGFAQDTADEYKVLFIGIDGVRSDALKQQIEAGNAPNLKSMFDTGLYTFDSWHMGVTSSGPSWSDMLTGVWEAKHGVTSNNYTGSNWNSYPYFPTRVKECRPNAKAVQITSWTPMSTNVTNDGWDNKITPPSDDACAAVAANQLADPALDILFVHIDDVDAAGHGNGFNPQVSAYMNAIAYADSKVGQILTALQNRPNYANEKWVVLATTDHGGSGTGHGGNSDDERHIWWVATGHNVPQQEITATDPGSYQFGTPPSDAAVAQTPVLTDIAATAIDHLIPGSTCQDQNAAAWDLDGKSWLSEDVNTSGIEENELANNLGVYPNPNEGIFDVVVRLDSKEAFSVFISDLTGKVVYTSELEYKDGFNYNKIDISNLNSGNYFLTVQGESSSTTRKIIMR